MKPRVIRVDFNTKLPLELDREFRQYCERTGTPLQDFAQAAFERHLKTLLRLERKSTLDMAAELQKRHDQPSSGPSGPQPPGMRS